MAVRWRLAAARVVVVAALVGGLGAAGLAGASGSHPARRGGVPEVWPVAPARGGLVAAGELGGLRASARGSGREVELRRLATGRSRTFVAGDGSLVRRFAAHVGRVGGELSWGAGGSGRLARLAWGGLSIELGVDAATFGGGVGAGTLPAPRFDGLTASYKAVAGGVDVRVQGDGEGFEQRIVIAQRPSGPVSFRFPLRLGGLRARVGAKGVVEFLDGAGSVVARSSPGRVAGAQTDTLTDQPIKTAAVSSRVVDEPGGGQALEVVPDPSFMRDARVDYPVTVDPGAIGSFGGAKGRRSRLHVRSHDPCGPAPRGPAPGVGGSCPAPSTSPDPVFHAANICTDTPMRCEMTPGPPYGVTATAYNEKVAVTWGAPVEGDPPQFYTVALYRASDQSLVAWRSVSPDAPLASFTFRDGVVNGQGYYGEVVASNEGGDSPGSASAAVTTAAVPWSAADTLGGANPSEPAVTCRSSWGVDCGTGNFSWSHTHLSVPGRGIPLGLTTTYNSQSVFRSLDPERWTTNYQMRVETKVGASGQPDAAIVHQENGSTVYFFDDGQGPSVPPGMPSQDGWHAEGGAQATLTGNPRVGFTFRRTHALTSFGFNPAGQLVSESDRNGYTTSVY